MQKNLVFPHRDWLKISNLIPQTTYHMKHEWIKVFVCNDDYQVAAMAVSNDDDYPAIKVAVDIGGINAAITYGYKEEAKRDEVFVGFDQAHADRALAAILKDLGAMAK